MFRKYYFSVILLNLIITSVLHPTNKNIIYNETVCNVAVGNKNVNLNNLYRPEGYHVVGVTSDFYLNICGTVPKCITDVNDDVAACELNKQGNKTSVLGLLRFTTILSRYKPVPGLSYHYKDENNKNILTEIEFKCNRHTTKNIVSYPQTRDKGKKHKFVFESSLVCVKPTMNCLVTDIDNFQYDLQPLYKSRINYKIEYNGSQIFLNICGNLNLENNAIIGDCLYDGTQICLVNNQGKKKNLGIFTSGFSVINDNPQVVFTGGSWCAEGKYIETQIDFICSLSDKAPVIISSTFCKFNIHWYTPIACPHIVTIHSDCQIRDQIFELRDFKNVLSFPKTFELDNSNLLTLSVCKPLDSCGIHKNVSICVENKEQKYVFGWENSTIILRDGLISMKFYGDICTSGKNRMSELHFYCTYSKQQEGKIHITENICNLKILYFTIYACPIHDVRAMNCKFKTIKGTLYDLSPLSKLDNNYEIVDTKSPDLFYVINICRPIVYEFNARCDPYSSVCLRNDSEPDFRKKFLSFGSYSEESSKIGVVDGHLSIDYTDGLCKGSDSRSSEIRFLCVEKSLSKLPTLLYKNDCHIIFEWQTHYSCPIEKKSKNLYNSEEVIKKSVVPIEEIVKYSKNVDLNLTFMHENLDERILKTQKDLRIHNNHSKTDLFIKSCIISDESRNSTINMTNLPHNVEVTSSLGQKYSLNVCGHGSKCGALICGGLDLKVPYGSQKLTNFKVNESDLHVEFTFVGSMICQTGFYSAALVLKCSKFYHQPTVIYEDDCSVQFEWRTNVSCAVFGISGDEKNGADTYTGVIVLLSFLILFGIAFIVFLVFYYSTRERNYTLLEKETTKVFYTKNTRN